MPPDLGKPYTRTFAALVPSSVEKNANLVVPVVAVIALHPRLFQVVVVFLLRQLVLPVLGTLHLDVAVDCVVTSVAPRVFPRFPARDVRGDVVIHLPAFYSPHARVAVKRRGFEG